MNDATLQRSFVERFGTMVVEIFTPALREAAMQSLQGVMGISAEQVQHSGQQNSGRGRIRGAATATGLAASSPGKVLDDARLLQKEPYTGQDVGTPSSLVKERRLRHQNERGNLGTAAPAPDPEFVPRGERVPPAAEPRSRSHLVIETHGSEKTTQGARNLPEANYVEGTREKGKDSGMECVGAPSSSFSNGDAELPVSGEVPRRLGRPPILGDDVEENGGLLGVRAQERHSSVERMARTASGPWPAGEGAVHRNIPVLNPPSWQAAGGSNRQFQSQSRNGFAAGSANPSRTAYNVHDMDFERGFNGSLPRKQSSVPRGHFPSQGASHGGLGSLDPESIPVPVREANRRANEVYSDERRNRECESMPADYERLKKMRSSSVNDSGMRRGSASATSVGVFFRSYTDWRGTTSGGAAGSR